jgi:hypothetical protein
MATIADCIRSGVLVEFAMPDSDHREPRRKLFVAESLFDWIDGTERLYDRNWSKQSGGRTMAEHLERTFADFRASRFPLVGDLKRVQPDKKLVWKIHSPGLRIFGWVPQAHQFVCVTADFVENTHGPGSTVKLKISQVLDFANRHQISATMQRGDHIALFPHQA